MSLTDKQYYELYKKYWNLYEYTYKGETFTFRELTRKEYREVIEYIPDELDREEWVCSICVIEPKDYNFEETSGALVTNLTRRILAESGFASTNTGKINNLAEKFIEEMNSFQHQISCIISEAFPNLDLEAIEDFNLEKTLWYYSRAKYKLEALRGVVLQNANQSSSNQHHSNSGSSYKVGNGTTMEFDGNADSSDAPELAQIRAFMKGREDY